MPQCSATNDTVYIREPWLSTPTPRPKTCHSASLPEPSERHDCQSEANIEVTSSTLTSNPSESPLTDPLCSKSPSSPLGTQGSSSPLTTLRYKLSATKQPQKTLKYRNQNLLLSFKSSQWLHMELVRPKLPSGLKGSADVASCELPTSQPSFHTTLPFYFSALVPTS